MKKIYNHKGYYNGLDAVIYCDLEPQVVINYINYGIGKFFTCENETDDEEHLLDNGGRIAGNIIIVDSVREIYKQTPLKLLVMEDLSDEFVDVWEFSHIED